MGHVACEPPPPPGGDFGGGHEPEPGVVGVGVVGVLGGFSTGTGGRMGVTPGIGGRAGFTTGGTVIGGTVTGGTVTGGNITGGFTIGGTMPGGFTMGGTMPGGFTGLPGFLLGLCFFGMGLPQVPQPRMGAAEERKSMQRKR